MKVKEFIKLLEREDQEMELVIHDQYGIPREPEINQYYVLKDKCNKLVIDAAMDYEEDDTEDNFVGEIAGHIGKVCPNYHE